MSIFKDFLSTNFFKPTKELVEKMFAFQIFNMDVDRGLSEPSYPEIFNDVGEGINWMGTRKIIWDFSAFINIIKVFGIPLMIDSQK